MNRASVPQRDGTTATQQPASAADQWPSDVLATDCAFRLRSDTGGKLCSADVIDALSEQRRTLSTRISKLEERERWFVQPTATQASLEAAEGLEVIAASMSAAGFNLRANNTNVLAARLRREDRELKQMRNAIQHYTTTGSVLWIVECAKRIERRRSTNL